jgi:pimeloyl-ACP methyl ester carboxylesterase
LIKEQPTGIRSCSRGETLDGTKAADKSTPTKSGHIGANELNYYYDIHGKGEPLLILHGVLSSIEMFGPVLPNSGKRPTVDLLGHGRTLLGDYEMSLIDMGHDMSALVKALGYDQVDVLGYSFGGGVAFRLAVQQPEAARRLVIVSAGFTRDGFYPEMLPMQAQVGAAGHEGHTDLLVLQSDRSKARGVP